MEIIRTLLYSLGCIVEKITKKEHRSCAIIVVGSIAVAAIAFSSNALDSGGKNDVYAAADAENPPDEGEGEDAEMKSLSGIAGVISGVLVTQDTNNEVGRIGTSLEAVLVGQRTGKQTKVSQINVGKEVATSVDHLGDHSWDAVENNTKMSDRDYETLLSIVEAESGGEDLKGRIMVANVIFNRVADDEFPDNITDVVWEKVNGVAQFSPTIDGRINKVEISDTTREAVNRAIDGEDYSQGALYFVAKDQAAKHNVQWFEKDLKELFSYGVHDFYTNP